MTNANANDARRAHDVLDGLFAGRILSRENEQLLRSFLPELPKQKTLTELRHEVNDAWVGADGNEWPDDAHGVLETWLLELHEQLQGLENAAKPAKPAHPEFLETEADYQKAPEGTIVACDDSPPCHKFGSEWSSVLFCGMKDNRGMSRAIRRVLRWGNE